MPYFIDLAGAFETSLPDASTLGAPHYLAEVGENKAYGLAYAAAGFHTSVTRGMAGGCTDSPSVTPGLKANERVYKPLNDINIRGRWENAADAYLNAYNAIAGGSSGITAMLDQANNLADSAYKAEGVAPPEAPTWISVKRGNAAGQTKTDIAGASAAPSIAGFSLPSIGLAGLAGFLMFGGKKTSRKSRGPRRVRGPRKRR